MARFCCLIMLMLLVGACAQLGVSDFLQSHPTADECAALGQQIDASTQRCVAVPPKAAARSPKNRTRVAAQSAAAMTDTVGEPVEPGAQIDAALKDETKLISGLVGLVRARGFHCDTISSVKPFSESNGFKLACDRFSNRYNIKDRGGRLVVTVD